MEIIILKKTGVPKAEVEAHQQIQREFSSSDFSKNWRGYASFAISRPGRGSGDDDFDLVLVTHAIILIVELKNWHGKLLESDGQSWFLDGENRDTSPVVKANLNAKKLASLMKQRLGPGFTPFVKSIVVMHGNVREVRLTPEEQGSVMTMSEFLSLRYSTAFRAFNPQPAKFDVLKNLSKYDEFFQGKNFKPKEYLVDGFRPEEMPIFQHPNKLYSEFRAAAKDDPLSLALLRQWDFSALGLDLIGEKDRVSIGLREQRVYEFVASRDEDLSLNLLRPISRKSANDVTLDFTELFSLPSRVTRLAEFTNSVLPKLESQERVALVKTLFQKFARLHELSVAHRDVSDHSIWLDRSCKVIVSGFPAAYFPEMTTVGTFRDKVKVEKISLPEDEHGSLAATPYRRDVFMLGALAYLILYGEKPPKTSGTYSWSVRADDVYGEGAANVIQRALEPDPTKRFSTARDMLEAFNASFSAPDLVVVDPRTFDAFRAHSRERDYEISAELADSDEYTCFRSTEEGRDFLVKAWHGIEPDPKRPDASIKLLSFLERARAIKSCAIPGIPRVVDYGLSRRDLLVVSEWIEGEILQGWLGASPALDDRLSVAGCLIDSISRLHSLGLAHGDIHPGNIVIGSGNIPYLVDILDYRRGAADAYTVAYLPANYKSLSPFERDIYSVAAVLADVFETRAQDAKAGVLPLPRVYEELANIFAADVLSTLDPLARAISEAANPSEAASTPRFNITIPNIDLPETPPILLRSDNGKLHVSAAQDRGVEDAIRIYVSGVGQQLSFQWSLRDGVARYAKLTSLAQSQLLRNQNQSAASVEAQIVISKGAFTDVEALVEYLLEHESIKKRLQPAPFERVQSQNFESEQPLAAEREPGIQTPAPYTRVPILELWKALIDAEEDAFFAVTIAGEKRDDPSSAGQILIPYHADSGVLDYEKSDIVLVESQFPDGSWKQCGHLNLDDTTFGENAELAIEQVHFKASFRIGMRLRLVSKDDKASFSRRRAAVDRILEDKAIISHLISYFDEENPLELRPIQYPAPSDEDLEIYSQPGRELNPSQLDAFKAVLSNGPISLLQGPPGTGKTQFIASLLHYLMTKDGARRILLVSQAHEAVNNALEKGLELCRGLGVDFNAVRLGPEGSCSETIRHLHSASIEQRYRETFKSEQKERIVELAAAFGLPRPYAAEIVALHLRLGILGDRLHKLQQRAAIADEKHAADLQPRINALSEVFYQIASDVYESGRELPPAETIQAIVMRLNSEHEVHSPDAVSRLVRLIALSEEWVSTLGTYDANFAEFLAKSRTVVAGTLVGIGNRATGVVQNIYDWVIIDEAGRAAPSELAVAMQAGHRILLVGDHKQLPPTFSTEVKKAIKARFDADEDSLLLSSDFERVFLSTYGEAVGASLLTQYRMAPAIGHIASNCFYGGALETGRGAPPDYYDLLPSHFSHQVAWVDTSGLGKRGQDEQNEDGDETWNDGEAVVVMNLLRQIIECEGFMEFLLEDLRPQEPPIGIICMYSKQRELIDKYKAEATWLGAARRLVKVDTVDSYQGKENRIVIVSTVRNNPRQRPGFLRSPNRINVAISRAMERLFIVGSTEMWKGRNASLPLGRVLQETEVLAKRQEAAFLPATLFWEQ